MIRVLIIVFMAAIAGCSGNKQEADNSQTHTVVATVGGVNITMNDLHTASLRSLKKEYSELPKALQQRLLDSVISTKAMSQAAQSQAQVDEKATVESLVAAYLEELWVKEYLKENAIPQPVSNQQIEEYYTTHPEYFGGGQVVDYTHVRCQYSENITVKDCTKLLAENDLKSWREVAEQHADITVINASLNTLLEKHELSQVVLNTQEQKFSGLKSTSSGLNRIFVIKKRTLTPKPLVTVQKEIRERLAPLQLKKAIKEASKRARSNIDIVRKI